MRKAAHLILFFLLPALLFSCSGAPALTGGESGSGDGDSVMQICIRSGDISVAFVLNDSIASKALYAQLPLTVTVSGFGSNEKIFYPPDKLSTASTPLVSRAEAGTLAYYAPWGNVVMFFGPNGPAGGLYELGKAVSGGDQISSLSGEIVVEILE